MGMEDSSEERAERVGVRGLGEEGAGGGWGEDGRGEGVEGGDGVEEVWSVARGGYLPEGLDDGLERDENRESERGARRRGSRLADEEGEGRTVEHRRVLHVSGASRRVLACRIARDVWLE